MEEEGWRRWLTDWWKLNRMQSLGGGAPDEAEAVQKESLVAVGASNGLKYEGHLWSPPRLSISAHVNARCSTYHSTYYNLIKTGAGPSWWCDSRPRDFNKISLSSVIGRDGGCERPLSAFSLQYRRTRWHNASLDFPRSERFNFLPVFFFLSSFFIGKIPPPSSFPSHLFKFAEL